MIKLICDIGGADSRPQELIKGICEAVNIALDLHVIISGDAIIINEELKKYTYDTNKISVCDASEVITNYDNPIRAIKEKPDSSLVKGLTLLKDDDTIQGMVCMGSTGATLVGSTVILGKINNCRPALAAILPNEDGGVFCLVDCGSNIDCKSEQLLGFAKMGVAYMKAACNIKYPRVGLLSNGSEETKGNALTKETHKLLEQSNLNFVGNIEGTKILTNNFDVLICDGFDGNIILKNIEGTAKTIIKDIYKGIEQSDTNEAMLRNKIISELIKHYDFNSLGGAVLLGVNKIICKGHGAGNSDTIRNTLFQAYNLALNELVNKIRKEI